MNEQNEQISFEQQEAQSPQPQELQPQKWWQKLLSELKSKEKPFYKRWWVWIAVALVVALAILLFSGDPVQDDLIDYINNDLTEAGELENEVIALYDEARELDNDYLMYVMIKEKVLPKAMEWEDAVEAIEPETEEVRAAHELYIDTVNQNTRAFTMMLAALEEQDYALATEANQMLDKARKSGRDYVAAIKALAQEHNVEFND